MTTMQVSYSLKSKSASPTSSQSYVKWLSSLPNQRSPRSRTNSPTHNEGSGQAALVGNVMLSSSAFGVELSIDSPRNTQERLGLDTDLIKMKERPVIEMYVSTSSSQTQTQDVNQTVPDADNAKQISSPRVDVPTGVFESAPEGTRCFSPIVEAKAVATSTGILVHHTYNHSAHQAVHTVLPSALLNVQAQIINDMNTSPSAIRRTPSPTEAYSRKYLGFVNGKLGVLTTPVEMQPSTSRQSTQARATKPSQCDQPVYMDDPHDPNDIIMKQQNGPKHLLDSGQRWLPTNRVYGKALRVGANRAQSAKPHKHQPQVMSSPVVRRGFTGTRPRSAASPTGRPFHNIVVGPVCNSPPSTRVTVDVLPEPIQALRIGAVSSQFEHESSSPKGVRAKEWPFTSVTGAKRIVEKRDACIQTDPEEEVATRVAEAEIEKAEFKRKAKDFQSPLAVVTNEPYLVYLRQKQALLGTS
eukprot:GILK01006819.1.p1 GENE.GILK01006819.1~~GILK01006819.1.p1  ORF type:complete len:487 (-),score=67.88 GILK01006819.1:218-1624(-)